MKIYNKDKTQILENPNQELGYLKEDIITHYYPEVKAVEEQGHYETIAEYPNGGKDVKWVVEVEGVEYQPARTETEKIYVYIPFSKKELEDIKLNKLRLKREPLLKAYDIYKINVLYGIENISTLSGENAKNEIDEWYKKILDLDEVSINNPPKRIKYYL